MPFRFPDAPKPEPARVLSRLKDGQWIAQTKMAGWRCLVEWNGMGDVRLLSRENIPIAASLELMDEIRNWLRTFRVPKGFTLDAEYMGKFDGMPEGLVIFDVLRNGENDLRSNRCVQRFKGVRFLPETEHIKIVEWADADYLAFYERTKTIRGCEGVVLKRSDSAYIGNAKKQSVNPGWIKVKHREGVANHGQPKNPRPPKPAPILLKPTKSPKDAGPDAWISPSLRPMAVDIARCKPDPNNARMHPKWNVDRIQRSLRRFGQQKPIVCDKAGVVRAGNGTLAAAILEGKTKIAAVFSDLSEAEIVAYAIADNHSGENSVWDEEKLAAALAGMSEDLRTSAGFDDGDLERMLGDPSARGIDAPAPTGAPRSKPGDLWTLGDHTVLCGSATDPEAWKRLLGRRTAALVHTDPPYGVSYEGTDGEKIKGDDLRDDALLKLLAPAFKLMARHADECAAFYIWHASSTRRDFEAAMTAAGLVEVQYLIWAKPSPNMGHADYQWSHEPAFYAAKAGNKPAFYGDRTKTSVWRVTHQGKTNVGITPAGGIQILDGQGASLFVSNRSAKGKKLRKVRLEDGQTLSIAGDESRGTCWEIGRDLNTVHPTQKPVELARRAIENSSKAGELVVDPFMGSGTTLVAAEITGRRAAGFELDPKHCDTIVRRWEALTGKAATRTDAKGKAQKGM